MWAASLLERVIRLNYGPVEVFRIHRHGAWFPVSRGAGTIADGVQREDAPYKTLASADCLFGDYVPVARAFDRSEAAFRQILESVRDRYSKKSFLNAAARDAHARGLLGHLDGRFACELPRPAWDFEENASTDAPLFHEAVFTAIHPDRRDEGILLMNGVRWARSLRSIEQARASESRMPLLFGDAASSVSSLIGWGLVVDIDVGDRGTRIEWEHARSLAGHSITELTKLSDGAPISQTYQRAYVPCATPDFLHDERGAPIGDDAFRLEWGLEGRRRLFTHFRIERNRGVVEAAKARWREQDPLLRCEVCGFSAKVTYGEDYVEAHHRLPLASLGGRLTRPTIEDLARVCANCHRALHRCGDTSVEALARRLRKTASDRQREAG